ncbi:perlucin-like protein [Mercenaria mercenaria]|uniref:perlucin-like protein n=1 Tax=Mercenaria mercenaria TaxID=6596 RepID=UPI00234EEEE8|nr:perlucin-like protein [Mercenaria mercenaria]
MRDLISVLNLVFCLFFTLGLVDVQSQMIAVCPDYSVSYHGSCYIFGFGQTMLVHQADKFCRDNHDGHVVEVNTRNESSFLKNYMNRLPRTENYWLGMTDERTEHEWRWFNTDTQVSVFDWSPGDPDNVPTDEDCAIFWSDAGYKWADVPCSTFKAEPVCELSLLDETEIIG